MEASKSQDEQAAALTQILCGELFRALGFATDGLMARVFTPLAWKAIHRFSIIAAEFDYRVAVHGFQQASQWFIPNFVASVEVSGAQNIPTEGPLLITANHPGAYDTLVITANIPRDDIKIFVNIPLIFINEIPATKPHFVFSPPDPQIRMRATREALQHLKNGGAVLIFAGDGMDPDPDTMSGAELALDGWSRSLELFARRVPETQILITMISGIIEPYYVSHPLTVFRRERRDKQRISEFLQIMQQMRAPGQLLQSPRLSFARPFTKSELPMGPNESFMGHLIHTAKKHFSAHMQAYPSH